MTVRGTCVRFSRLPLTMARNTAVVATKIASAIAGPTIGVRRCASSMCLVIPCGLLQAGLLALHQCECAQAMSVPAAGKLKIATWSPEVQSLVHFPSLCQYHKNISFVLLLSRSDGLESQHPQWAPAVRAPALDQRNSTRQGASFASMKSSFEEDNTQMIHAC